MLPCAQTMRRSTCTHAHEEYIIYMIPVVVLRRYASHNSTLAVALLLRRPSGTLVNTLISDRGVGGGRWWLHCCIIANKMCSCRAFLTARERSALITCRIIIDALSLLGQDRQTRARAPYTAYRVFRFLQKTYMVCCISVHSNEYYSCAVRSPYFMCVWRGGRVLRTSLCGSIGRSNGSNFSAMVKRCARMR